ncbi:MAG TPA: DUF3000 domain-containing protein [Ornithinimicrobium sp.]|uniref:DUF3000 domain-containing protein n=1 Tax=Ornithinimicrobium sp. TaxID=1977084 RepID=UPI002B4A4090|nr:DUF3000 domain-containing protein [Ornithinimicrobium sp.]HKJ10977.1 DUF3000 domain-containing protein [Ornithinimicrobium sp.]
MVSRIRPARPPAKEVDSTRDATTFDDALEALRTSAMRPELVIEEVPAPTRLAPHAVALAGEVIPGHDTHAVNAEDPLGVGRFVLLFDPAGPEPWEGQWRAVTYAKTTIEPEVGSDPLAGEVGWSWLTEALQARGLGWSAEAGTVTSVSSQSFGALAERDPVVELEIRASWTPEVDTAAQLGGHVQAWGDLLCTLAGLPPLPEGVVALPGVRR